MKHFIHLNDFSKQEIIQIFELADKFIVRHKDNCGKMSEADIDLG